MANIYGFNLIRCAVGALIFISWSTQSLAFDKEGFCRSGMKAHQERAEWGSRLRSEMLRKCRGTDLQKCGQQYVNQINKQYEKDMFELVEIFNRDNLSQVQRVGMRALVVEMQSAALEALKFEKTPNSIVLDMYSECLRVR
jgi:hypothetical protein